MVEQCNNLDGTVDYLMVEQWHGDRRTVEQRRLKSKPSDSGTVKQSWWNN